MVATVGAIALTGLAPTPVDVEAVTDGGLPGTRIVGLPDTAVREAAERVGTAIKRTPGLAWGEGRRLVNLSPAAVRKEGSGFDLAVALALLAAVDAKQLPPAALAGVYAVGELALDGTVRSVPGVLPIARGARQAGAARLLTGDRMAVEASLIDGLEVVPVADLAEAVAVLTGARSSRPAPPPAATVDPDVPDLCDVRGQHMARRALEIAAAGGHHLLMVGPPGCGKSMLARRIPGVLPRLTVGDALEVAAVHSVAGARAPDDPLSRIPPFRDPHTRTSAAGLIGGGSGVAGPGEVSLAHRGVLFLDELLEMSRSILDALRQPLETGSVTIVRSRAAVRYPARVLLVAATNPCPCGHLGSGRRACRCRPHQIRRYRSRLSGPLLDRIDLQVELRPVDRDALLGAPQGEPSAQVAARVRAARAAAAERWGEGVLVRDAGSERLRAASDPGAVRTAGRAVEALGLSARGFDRCLRVARTIADLDGAAVTRREHVEEAVGYRLAPSLAAS